MYANFTPTVAYAVHTSGALQTIPNTKLNNANWYKDDLQPTLEQYLKGDYVYTKGAVQDYADNSGK
jgi:chitin synthase